ncbi:hypothetical protein V6N13_074072 [Hibiscus sabdariffa]
MNLSQQGDFARVRMDWDLTFSAVLWNIWRQRNDRVFNGITEEWGSVITRSKWLAESSAAASVSLRQQQFRGAGRGARHSNGRPFTIIHSIHLLCDLEWSLVFSKVDRCLNGVADSLAKSN